MSVSQLVAELEAEDKEKKINHATARTQVDSLRIVGILQLAILFILLALPMVTAVRLHAVADPDIWWHMRTGEWIVQTRSIPNTDQFSSFASGKPWAAYSWIFELLTFGLFQKFGLIGLLAYTAAMVLAITWAIHRLVRSLQNDFTVAALITATACFCLARLWTPRSWLFSILFFVLELHILLRARRSGRPRDLIWLPLVFMLWANLHIQFVDGLIVLAIALIESFCVRLGMPASSRLSIRASLLVLIASLSAICCNPYGWHIYRIAYDIGSQPGILDKVQELQALPFRSISDWCILLLALASTAAIARSRQVEAFELALLAFAVYVCFRSQRDIWILIVVASLILASRIPGRVHNYSVLTRLSEALAFLMAIGITVSYGAVSHLNNANLNLYLRQNLPVDAVNAAKTRGLGGPLYNDFSWGGYLIWAMRLPVTIDGRTVLHGDEHINRSVATWSAKKDWASDPELMKANLVIAPVESPLTQVLRISPTFHLVFEDRLAAVFVSSTTRSTAAAMNRTGQR